MKCESPVFAHMFDSELNNEIIAYAVQIKTALSLKMLRMHFQHQIEEVSIRTADMTQGMSPAGNGGSFGMIGQRTVSGTITSVPSLCIFSNVPHFLWWIRAVDARCQGNINSFFLTFMVEMKRWLPL